MDIKNIGSISLNELGDALKNAQTLVDSQMGKLSNSDRLKAENIIKSVESSDLEGLKNKLEELTKNKNA
jgi:hypothetical protein